MKRVLSSLLSFILALSLNIPAFAENSNAGCFDYDEVIESVLNYKMQSLGASSVQDLVDKMAEEPASGNEWYVMCIRNYAKNIDYSLYRNALEEYVSTASISSATSRERIALTLLSLNSSSEFINKTANDSIGVQGLMSYIFGLHLLNNGAVSDSFTVDDIIEYILSVQGEDGGWSLSGGQSDPDISAMVIEALASRKNDTEISESLKKAVEFLSSAQLEDGGYKSYGSENPESACQVIMALASIGIDAINSEDFIKNGVTLSDYINQYKIAEGQYAHQEGGAVNKTTQNQVLYSSIAYKMFMEDSTLFYNFPQLSETKIQRNNIETDSINTKTILYIAIAVLFVILCIVNIIRGKKNFKSYISAAVICAIAAAGVSFISVQKTDDYYQKETELVNPIHTTISIYCNTVAGQKDYIPEDGIILQYCDVTVSENASVYDQLVNACKENTIQMESDGGSYVNGIKGIYEYNFGDLSGWMFKINGEFSSVGCNEAKLKDGDYVEWVYTTNLGKDVGNDYSTSN